MSETGGNLRKRMFGEADDAEDLIKQKSICSTVVETDSRDTLSSSCGSSLVSSNDEQTTLETTSSADVQIQVDSLTDVPKLQQLDAWKFSKLRHRRWVYTDSGRMLRRNSGDNCQKNGFKFTVASYNILAQNLLEDNSYLYSHCRDPRYLEWSYRQHQLLDEITYYKPDILCCQEIHEKHYTEFFYPEMEKLGYQGSFKKRTRAMRDGCATFFKKTSFECEAEVPVEYFVPDVASLDRDNVAVLLLLQPKNCLLSAQRTRSAKLCVANTHLLFNPRRGDVKLAQLMKLFAEIDRLTYQPCPAGPLHRNHHPVLICGDLNMEPFSHLYSFVRRGKLVLDGQLAAELSGQEQNLSCGYSRPMKAGFLPKHAGLTDQCQYVSVCQQKFNKVPNQTDDTVLDGVHRDTEPQQTTFIQGSGIVSHKFDLHSVYTHFVKLYDDQGHCWRKSAREVTTCHTRANCTVDYIFYTPFVSVVSHSEHDCSHNSASQMTHHAGSDQCHDEHQCRVSASDAAPILASSNESSSNVRQQSSGNNAACDITDYRLTLLARLQLLSDKEMNVIGQLPNSCVSSDHMILAAQFLLTSD